MYDQFWFDVGHQERHRVEFYCDRMWGQVRIHVDGQLAQKKLLAFSVRLTHRFRFTVGHQERHEVLIVRKRPLILSVSRPSTYRIFVDGAPFLTLQGQP
ncbi:hypothetical protein AB0L25_39945 [Spirillospora sp. NPDC052242]